MALSEKEKEWLERRAANEMAFDAFFCPHCSQFNVERDPYLGHCDDDTHCPLANQDFQDAAEFEARVAQRLVQNISWPCYAGLCPGGKDMDWQICPKEEWCHMKYARIAAEAEMDA